MNIEAIESIKELDLMLLQEKKKEIKGHNCYFVDLGGHFGYSVLVFKNGKQIKYANDYQLHYGNLERVELREFYIKQLNRKLFTDSELMEPVRNYDEYQRKSYFLRNLWILQFESVSAWHIGKFPEELERKIKKMYYCPTCFCYVESKQVADMAFKFMENLEISFLEAKKNIEVFREMISDELANHEAGYTGSCREALAAVGLTFDELNEEQQQVVLDELKKQIDYQESN